MKTLYTAKDAFETQRLQDLLNDSGIPSYTQDSGSGEYMKIVGNYNVFGTDIVVNDQDYDKAKALLDEYRKSEEKPEDSTGMLKIPWYKNKMIIARILIGWAMIGVIVCIIANIVN